MSGTIQILSHSLLAGTTLAVILPYVADRGWVITIATAVSWLGFWGHVAVATWIPSWGRGPDWVDRSGILIRGSGLAACTIAIVLDSSPWSIAWAGLGILLMTLGRPIWEILTNHASDRSVREE